MQTSHFLDEHGTWQQISVANTSMAAKKMMEDQDTTQAAVCNEYAAELYGLDILAREINDESDNSTRFYHCHKPEGIPEKCVQDQYLL